MEKYFDSNALEGRPPEFMQEAVGDVAVTLMYNLTMVALGNVKGDFDKERLADGYYTMIAVCEAGLSGIDDRAKERALACVKNVIDADKHENRIEEAKRKMAEAILDGFGKSMQDVH